MICFYLFYCFLWDRPVLVTLSLLFREVSRAFDLGFSTKCWLLAGFGKAFRSTKLPLTAWAAHRVRASKMQARVSYFRSCLSSWAQPCTYITAFYPSG
jgi:hypothetical protein